MLYCAAGLASSAVLTDTIPPSVTAK